MIRRWPLIPTIVVIAASATMAALGVWQLQRAEWKGDLIARYERVREGPAAAAWPRSEGEVESALFRSSGFVCERVLSRRAGAGTSAAGAKGWAHIARCAIDGGGEAEVALGWSREPLEPDWNGGEVTGIIGPGGDGAVLVAAPPQAGLQPLAAPDPRDLPNNHLAYAGQWFFFALTSLVIYWLALKGRRRRDLTRN